MDPAELKQYLVETGLTIKEVALKIGMKPTTLRGKISENSAFLDGEIEKVFEVAKELKKQKSLK